MSATTRRTLLRIAGATPAFLAPAALAMPANLAGTETEPVLALVDALRRAEAAHEVACLAYGETEEPIFEARRLGIAVTRAQQVAHDLAEEVEAEAANAIADAIYDLADTPSRSWLGVLAKLRALAEIMAIDVEPGDEEDLTEENRLILGALRDAERLLAD